MEGKDIPILALYGGKDDMIGFMQFARLREKALKYEEGIIAAKDFHFYMLKFCDDYFTKY